MGVQGVDVSQILSGFAQQGQVNAANAARRDARRNARQRAFGTVLGAGAGFALAGPLGVATAGPATAGAATAGGAAGLSGLQGALIGAQLGPAITGGDVSGVVPAGITALNFQQGNRAFALDEAKLRRETETNLAIGGALGLIPQTPSGGAPSPPVAAPPQAAPTAPRPSLSPSVVGGLSPTNQLALSRRLGSPQLRGIQNQLETGLRTAPNPEDRIAALQRAKNQSLGLGTSDGRGAANIYQKEIESIREQGTAQLGNEFTREAVGLGMSFPLTPQDIEEVNRSLAARKAQEATQLGRARGKADIQNKLDSLVPSALAEQFQLPIGTTFRQLADANLIPPDKLTPDQRKSISESSVALSTIEELDRLFKPEFVGPVAGRELAIKAVLGVGFTGQLTPDEAAFFASSNAFKNRIIKAITGAQMSEPEAKRILGEVPLITDPTVLWREKLKQSKKNLQLAERIARRKTGAVRTTSPTALSTTTQDNPAQPTTKAAFDALPSGAFFIDPDDGKLYQKD